jgi:hypothetical protein
MKSEEIYKMFTGSLDDLKKAIASLDDKFERKFESLEQKIDDRFVTKESLSMQLKSMDLRLSNYEEMRQDIRKMGFAIATAMVGVVISILLYILQSGLLKGIRL